MAARYVLLLQVILFLVTSGHWYAMVYLGETVGPALVIWTLILSILTALSCVVRKELKEVFKEVTNE